MVDYIKKKLNKNEREEGVGGDWRSTKSTCWAGPGPVRFLESLITLIKYIFFFSFEKNNGSKWQI